MRRDALAKACALAGVVLVALVLLPAVEEAALVGFLLFVWGAVVGLLALDVLWHLARRHPLLALLLGAWLLHRHERKVRRAIDARSWPAHGDYPSQRAPPDPRTRSGW